MRQVNSFLEHNLRESGEMLASLTRLQEDKQQLARTVAHLRDQIRQLEQHQRPDMYGRFLRSESYRKALIWQKRYLLVHIAGGHLDADPVLRVSREVLAPEGRFRAAVHAVIAICRMRFLVRRWRSGKRAGARLTPLSGSSSRAWSVASTSAPDILPPGGGSRQRPDSLSLHSSHSLQARGASSGPATPPTPRSNTGSLRRSVGLPGSGNGIRRTASLREPEDAARERSLSMRRSGGRPAGRSQRSASLLRSPSSLSSSSSQLQQPPVVTGRTPPTRDTGGPRSRDVSEMGSPAKTRRSLSSQFLTEPTRKVNDGEKLQLPVFILI
jgi:Pericentrin-AKAP-450 domain of centrosomal targeting protein